MAERVYRPAHLLRLKIRLEDFDESVDPEAESTDKPFEQKLQRLNTKIASLQKKQSDLRANSPQSAELTKVSAEIRKNQRARKKLEGAEAQGAAQTLEKGDVFSIDIVVVATSFGLELNSPRVADTLTATFPFRDAPLISDIIRSAQVDLLVGTIPEEDFADPARWRLSFQRGVLRFRGYVDTWETSHDDADATVSISARSLESILIDGKVHPLSKSFRIDGDGEKISAYVQRILDKFPPTSGKTGGDQLKAVWYGATAESEPTLDRKSLIRSLQSAKSRNTAASGPIPPGTDAPALPPAEGDDPAAAVGPPGQPSSGQKTPSQEMAIWDLITQACNIAGCIPVYDPSLPEIGTIRPADSILLRPANTLFEEVDGGLRIPDGPLDGFNRTMTFQGRPIQSDLRFMVWGHNIKSMSTSRKLGRIKAPGIEVRSLNPDAPPAQRLVKVRYPEAKRGTKIGAKGEAKVDEIITRVIRGVRDEKLLKQIAVSLYHQMARQEMAVHIETDDLSSYIDPNSSEVPNDVPDLLKLGPGSPCRVTVAREVKQGDGKLIMSPLSEVFEKRTSEIRRFLTEQAGIFRPEQSQAVTDKMVERIAKSLSSARLTDIFYCRSVNHDWDTESGWKITMELVNFLEARSLPKNLSETDKADDAERRPGIHPGLRGLL